MEMFNSNDAVSPDADTLNVPPFPMLKWDQGTWTGSVKLDSWAGFRVPLNSWKVTAPPPASDGTAELRVETLRQAQIPPTPEQTAAYQQLLDRESDIQAAIVQALFDWYPEEQSAFGYSAPEAEAHMPDLDQPEQLKLLIGLSTVHILATGRDNVPYVGFEFKCSWEPEHDLGVMTLNGEVVALGDAETAFTAWIADQEIERSQSL